MALDLDAIRRRLQELSGQRKQSSVQLWKPPVGSYKIRGLPWKNSSPDSPFQERWFYYFVNPGILAPHQFKEPDPINEFIRKLYSSGRPEDRTMAKELQPKMRVYMPIIVRGQEDKGVLVWSFGKLIYQKLLGYFVNDEVGNILDPETGFDLDVNITQVQGKQFQDTTVEAARRQTPLSTNSDQARAWLDSVPNIDDMYRRKSYDEINGILQRWLAGDDASNSQNDGTSKGSSAKTSDDLDKLVAEVSGGGGGDKAPRSKGRSRGEAVVKSSLDDAFADLMNDE